MRCTCSSAALAALAACTTALPPAQPRPPLPLPAATLQRYALPGPVTLAQWQPHAGGGDGELVSAGELARVHLLRPPGASRPLIVLVPILAGGEQLMRAIAERMVARGFAVGWCDRVAAAMRPPQRGAELEQLFRRTVVQQRMLLAWARTSELVDGSRCFVLGVSLGGMVGTALAAVEPQLCAAAICLGGADLPDLVLHSREGRVLQWCAFRRDQDGLSGRGIADELRARLDSDPLHLAPHVPTGKVLLVEAAFDDVVPPHNQIVLWEALGRPRRFTVPLGHYTAALAMNPILDAVGSFFAEALAAADASAASPPPAVAAAAAPAVPRVLVREP